jgi:hypothetical protein
MNPLRRSFMIHSSLALTAAVAMRPARVTARGQSLRRAGRYLKSHQSISDPAGNSRWTGKYSTIPATR